MKSYVICDEPAVIIEQKPIETFKSPISNLWDFDEEKYITADMAHIIAHDGISVKLREEPKAITPTIKIAVESVIKPQLSKE